MSLLWQAAASALRRGRRGAAGRAAVLGRRRVEDAEPDAHLDRLLGEHPAELPAAEDSDDGGSREADVAGFWVGRRRRGEKEEEEEEEKVLRVFFSP